MTCHNIDRYYVIMIHENNLINKLVRWLLVMTDSQLSSDPDVCAMTHTCTHKINDCNKNFILNNFHASPPPEKKRKGAEDAVQCTVLLFDSQAEEGRDGETDHQIHKHVIRKPVEIVNNRVNLQGLPGLSIFRYRISSKHFSSLKEFKKKKV